MMFDAISLDIIENIYWGNKLMTYRIHHVNCDFVEAKRSSPSVDAYSPGLYGLTCVKGVQWKFELGKYQIIKFANDIVF